MKRLVLLVIIMVLGISRAAIAGEDLDYLVNAEEGSSYYDLTYGAKLIGASQNTRERYEPQYTKEELANRLTMTADTDTGSATSLAALRAAVGEGTLGTSAITATAIETISYGTINYTNLTGTDYLGLVVKSLWEEYIRNVPPGVRSFQNYCLGRESTTRNEWHTYQNQQIQEQLDQTRHPQDNAKNY